jgi:imidazolonepropionase
MSSTDLVDYMSHGFVIEKGIFVKIGPTDEIESEFGRQGSISLNGRAIVPGLIDAHTHLLWGGDRSDEMRLRQRGKTYQDIASLGGGINYTVNATRNLSLDELLENGKIRLSHSLRNGTTALETKSGYGLDTESELKLLQAANQLKLESDMEISLTWLGAHNAPPNISINTYVEQIIAEQLPAVLDQGLAKSADVFCEDGWFTLEQTEMICKEAKSNGLDIRLHVDEFSDSNGLALAAELGATTADHALHSSDDNREAAHAAGTIQGFLPGTPYVHGSSLWPPIQYCIDHEYGWSLATDFNPNCKSLSLPMVGSIVTHRMNIDPLAVLVAVTRNPATTLVRDDELAHGIIAEGASANLNILRGTKIDGWCQTPGDTPFSATMCNGKIVKHE